MSRRSGLDAVIRGFTWTAVVGGVIVVVALVCGLLRIIAGASPRGRLMLVFSYLPSVCAKSRGLVVCVRRDCKQRRPWANTKGRANEPTDALLRRRLLEEKKAAGAVASLSRPPIGGPGA